MVEDKNYISMSCNNNDSGSMNVKTTAEETAGNGNGLVGGPEVRREVSTSSRCEVDMENEDDSENTSSKKHLSRSACEICEDNEHKYTCPGCGIKTCSLPCIRSHKAKLGCTGERDKTAFVDMTQYKDLHLLNDYRFLEDAERTIYSSKSTVKKPRAMTGGNNMSKRSKFLVNAAVKRGIKLRMLPQFLSKNKENSSFYIVKSDIIEWHMEWMFVTPGTVVKVKDQKVRETAKLMDAAGKFINPVEYPHLRKPLETLDKSSLPLCQFLLKVEGLPANRPRFFLLKPESPLASNLTGHCLTEHPSIHVVPESHCKDNYVLLDKEDMFHMSRDNARHMTRHFPELRVEEESQVLNPQSSIFVPDVQFTAVKPKPLPVVTPQLVNKPLVVPSPREIEKNLLTPQSSIFIPDSQQTVKPVVLEPKCIEKPPVVLNPQMEKSPVLVNPQMEKPPVMLSPEQTEKPPVVQSPSETEQKMVKPQSSLFRVP